jgi:hypothetical protein
MRSRRPRSIFGRPALFRDFQPERLELIEEVNRDGEPMRRQLAALFVSSVLVTASDTVTAHLSILKIISARSDDAIRTRLVR